MRPFNRSALFATAALPLLPCPAALAQWSVVFFHPETSQRSRVLGGAPGMVVGYSNLEDNISTPAVWIGHAHTLVNPDRPLGGQVFATDGVSCGGITKTTQYGISHATWWQTPDALMIDLHPPAADPYSASAVNAVDGLVQAGYVALAPDHAALWHGTAESWVDLHPSGTSRSRIWGAAGGQQVGEVWLTGNVSSQRASLWHGAADSWINLHAQGASSVALATDGQHQVGYSYTVLLNRRASLWSGTAASLIDLHPSADPSSRSQANAVCGIYQVGNVAPACCVDRAALWTGTAASYVDLGALLPPDRFDGGSFANAVWIEGNFLYVGGTAEEIVATGPGFTGVENRAVLWIKDLSPVGCGRADIGAAGGTPGRDGMLDNNDFIAFINYFFNADPAADMGQQGGFSGSDGQLDNNDFIAFINAFFAGC